MTIAASGRAKPETEIALHIKHLSQKQTTVSVLKKIHLIIVDEISDCLDTCHRPILVADQKDHEIRGREWALTCRRWLRESLTITWPSWSTATPWGSPSFPNLEPLPAMAFFALRARGAMSPMFMSSGNPSTICPRTKTAKEKTPLKNGWYAVKDWPSAGKRKEKNYKPEWYSISHLPWSCNCIPSHASLTKPWKENRNLLLNEALEAGICMKFIGIWSHDRL